MNNLEIENTKKTPKIAFDPDGKMKITGRSIPEDPSKFYDSVLLWLQDYVKTPAPKTVIDIELEYFNSGTSKFILQILRELKEVKEAGNQVEINWYYEVGDDDILERGEYYQSILEIDLNFIQVDYE
jgi:hypothetical protein